MSRRNWIVSISQEDADSDMVFGPYVERRAHELAEQFNTRIDAAQTGWIFATAYPIQNLGITAMLAEYGREAGA